MPILSVRPEISVGPTTGHGPQTSPGDLLRINGPCIRASIEIAGFLGEQWLREGRPIPPTVKGYALIDTGASDTCIDDSLAIQVGFPITDVVNVASASHRSSLQNVFPIKITLVGLNVAIEAPTAIGAALSSQGFVALIGRDFLQHCALFYNGLNGDLTLSI